MLKTFINTTPFTKFVLITDSLENRDIKLFDYIINQHINKKGQKVHYCVFEGVFKRTQDKLEPHSNVSLHNFICNRNGGNDFEQLVTSLGNNNVIVIDSLANAILQKGIPHIYRILNSLKNNKGLKQIISVLHKDLIEGDSDKVSSYFNILSTLSLNIQTKFLTNAPRIQYEYKKAGGKVISQIEEYRFEGEHLITNKITNPGVRDLLEKPITNPEELSTFRIGLTDEEKLSRDKVVLPYLPDAKAENEEGKIFYQLDDIDDWDEEDPDDDLDI